jgi:hypothetical protein
MRRPREESDIRLGKTKLRPSTTQERSAIGTHNNAVDSSGVSTVASRRSQLPMPIVEPADFCCRGQARRKLGVIFTWESVCDCGRSRRAHCLERSAEE